MKRNSQYIILLLVLVGLYEDVRPADLPDVNITSIIQVIIKDQSNPDSIRIAQYNNFFNELQPDLIKASSKNKKGVYKFEYKNVKEPFYISISKEFGAHNLPKYLLRLYLVEPGDSVTIVIIRDSTIKEVFAGGLLNYPAHYRFRFSGKGAVKYSCRYQAEMAICTNSRISGFVKDSVISNKLIFPIINTIFDSSKNKISHTAFDILKVDMTSICDAVDLYWNSVYNRSLLKDSDFSNAIYTSYQSKLESYYSNFSNFVRTKSAYYFMLVMQKSLLEIMSKKHPFQTYIALKNAMQGELRDKVITSFALQAANTGESEQILNDAIETVKNKYYREELESYRETNLKGKPAYNFSLKDNTGKIMRLKDFENKVVFIDFWFVGCSACSRYYTHTISKVEEEFKNNPRVAFIAINCDTDINGWQKAITENKYTSAQIVNLNVGEQGLKNPVIDKFRVFTFPKPIIIGPDGRILNNDFNELRKSSPDKLIKLIYDTLGSN